MDDMARVATQPFLPRASRDAAIANLGELTRIHRVLDRLREGGNITLAAVGGSITLGSGYKHRPGGGIARRFTPPPGHGLKNMGWSRILFDRLAARWPPTAGSAHRYANGAIGAVQPPYFAMCLHLCLPPSADVLLLEFSCNSGNSEARRGMELLVRRALSWPGSPAVVLVSWSDGWYGTQRAYNASGRGTFQPTYNSDWNIGAGETARNYYQRLAEYYRLPHISARGALWRSDRDNTPGLRFEDFGADWNHPNAYGHTLLAEMVEHYLDVAQRLREQPGGAAEAGPRGGRAAREVEATDEGGLPVPIDARYALVDPTTEHVCLSEASLEAAARPVPPAGGRSHGATARGGFQWVTHDPDDPQARRKPGYLSASPGDVLRLRLPRVYDVVFLGALVSYGEHMGYLRATCVGGGCACAPLLVHGRHRDRTSVVVNVPLPFTRSTAGAACTLQLEHVRAEGRPPGAPSKVKLLSVVVAPPGGDVRSGFIWDETNNAELSKGVVA